MQQSRNTKRSGKVDGSSVFDLQALGKEVEDRGLGVIDVIEPSVRIMLGAKEGSEILKSIERAGRVCYKSEVKGTAESAEEFVRMLLRNGHLSVIEHESVSVRVVCDRGVSHEIVRHRIGSYSQESTRYVNYLKRGMQVINPCFWLMEDVNAAAKRGVWKLAMRMACMFYNILIGFGAVPQEARSVLPNSLKTELVMTYNLREWRHFFRLRCEKHAHPQMQQVAKALLVEINSAVPVVFEDQYEEFIERDRS